MPRVNVETVRRRARALELRASGQTYQQIGDELYNGQRANAYKDIQKALERETNEAASAYRHIELERLDAMTRAVAPAAFEGDLKAIETMLKIMSRRARYIPGLEVPKEGEAQVDKQDAVNVVFHPGLMKKDIYH